MYILSDFKEYACHSCILADRHILVICNVKILDNVVKDSLGDLSVFACTACFDRTFYVFRKMFICFDTEFFDDICKSAYFYFTHSGKLPSLFMDMPPSGSTSLFSLYQSLPVPTIPYHRYRNISVSAVRDGRILEAVMEILYQYVHLLSPVRLHTCRYDRGSFRQVLHFCILQRLFYRHFFRIR